LSVNDVDNKIAEIKLLAIMFFIIRFICSVSQL
jgi:hypothetical protein